MTPRGQRISRRGLLRAWLVSAVGVAAASVGGGATLRGATPQPIEARLGSLLRDRASAVAIGRARLAEGPGSGDRQAVDREAVAGAVAASVASVASMASMASMAGIGPSGLAGAGDQTLRALVDAAIRRDFARGDIVRVRGWLLSRTEVDLCVLAALDAERGAES